MSLALLVFLPQIAVHQVFFSGFWFQFHTRFPCSSVQRVVKPVNCEASDYQFQRLWDGWPWVSIPLTSFVSLWRFLWRNQGFRCPVCGFPLSDVVPIFRSDRIFLFRATLWVEAWSDYWQFGRPHIPIWLPGFRSWNSFWRYSPPQPTESYASYILEFFDD